MQITAEKFANTAKRAIEIREISYANGGYEKTSREAVEEAMRELEVDVIWLWPLTIYTFAGYAEADQWIEENKSK